MAQAPAIQTRKFQRGEAIFSPGPSPTCIYIVQTGVVSVCVLKDGCAQLQLVRPWQILREEALMSGSSPGTTAIALKETQILEIPIELIRTMANAAQPPLGALFKGLLERLKSASSELRSLRMNRGAQPCHPDLTAKVFGVIFYTARYLGKKEGEAVVVSWKALKTYAVETFHENETGLEEAIYALMKLGYASPRVESGEASKKIPLSDDWIDVCFTNLTQIEAFFDFYQNYHFKGGYAGLLKTHEKSTELTQALVRLADNYKMDRSGMVTMPYKATVDTLKETFGKSFEADQIFRLEQKGLCIKRTATEGGGVLSFLKSEFEQMLLNWKVLKEVEQWNDKGFVQLPEEASDGQGASQADDKESAQLKAALEALESWKPLVLSGGAPMIRTEPPRPDEILCPHCLSPVLAAQTYCSICDCEIPKKAA